MRNSVASLAKKQTTWDWSDSFFYVICQLILLKSSAFAPVYLGSPVLHDSLRAGNRCSQQEKEKQRCTAPRKGRALLSSERMCLSLDLGTIWWHYRKNSVQLCCSSLHRGHHSLIYSKEKKLRIFDFAWRRLNRQKGCLFCVQVYVHKMKKPS